MMTREVGFLFKPRAQAHTVGCLKPQQARRSGTGTLWEIQKSGLEMVSKEGPGPALMDARLSQIRAGNCQCRHHEARYLT